MVIAYHAIWSGYGFWLPNEDRGSWSTEVWAKNLRSFGPATKTIERHSLANRPYDPQRRQEMRASLKYPAVLFDVSQINAIGRGFAEAIERFNTILFACAILWDHVHIVCARHREPIEFVARVLKSAATRHLTNANLHPLAQFADEKGRTPTPWAEGGWERYLNYQREIVDAIGYVNGNPRKHDLDDQHWPFVKTLPPRGRGG
jgi:REP element-mobilizing transposase RayT